MNSCRLSTGCGLMMAMLEMNRTFIRVSLTRG